MQQYLIINIKKYNEINLTKKQNRVTNHQSPRTVITTEPCTERIDFIVILHQGVTFMVGDGFYICIADQNLDLLWHLETLMPQLAMPQHQCSTITPPPLPLCHNTSALPLHHCHFHYTTTTSITPQHQCSTITPPPLPLHHNISALPLHHHHFHYTITPMLYHYTTAAEIKSS